MYETKEPWYFNFVRRDIAALLPDRGDRDFWKDKFRTGRLSPLFVVQHLVHGLRLVAA